MVACPSGILWISILLVPTLPRIFRTSMHHNATKVVRARRSRSCKQNAGWPHSVSASYGTITKNSNIIEVGLIIFVCDWLELTRSGVLAEMSSNKSDRSMSPSTMSEESRRELLARQHRALYGNDASNFLPQGGFGEEGTSARDSSSNIPTTAAGGMRGNSPRTADPFGMGQLAGQQATADKANPASSIPHQDVGRAETATSPATGTAPAQFGNIDTSIQQPSNSSTSPTGGESPTRGINKSTTAPIGSGMVPIGTRLSQQQPPPSQSINKRSTTPLTSPMNNFGFGSSEQTNSNERSASSNSNPPAAQKEASAGIAAWGTGSGVWGSNKIGATSVWG
jgi:hypothetical protein